MTQTYQTHSTAQADYSIRFTEGKLIFFQSGQLISLNSPIVLRNGIIILTDGTIRCSDGSIKRLQEGECIENSEGPVYTELSRFPGTR